MRDLFSYVSLYALSKVYNQYLLVTSAERNPVQNGLKTCSNTFAITMSLPCAYMIKTAMETEDNKILLEDIHPYWQFKKSKSSLLILTNDFLSDPLSVFGCKLFYKSQSERLDKSSINFDVFSEADNLIHSCTNQINLLLFSLALKDVELDNLLDINKPNVAKAKKIQRITKQEKDNDLSGKKAARSTKQNLSSFEFLEQEYKDRVKCAKKTAINEAGQSSSRQNKGRKDQNRGKKSCEEKCCGKKYCGATTILAALMIS